MHYRRGDCKYGECYTYSSLPKAVPAALTGLRTKTFDKVIEEHKRRDKARSGRRGRKEAYRSRRFDNEGDGNGTGTAGMSQAAHDEFVHGSELVLDRRPHRGSRRSRR